MKLCTEGYHFGMVFCSQTWLTSPKEDCDDFEVYLRRLREHMSSVAMVDLVGRRSKTVAARFRDFAPGSDFVPLETGINPVIQESNLSAGYRVDRLYRTSNQCLIATELAFNNRESIGTNFLKLATALISRESNPSKRAGVLIAPTRELLDRGGWDRSYGDSAEYEALFRAGYGGILNVNLVILELHGID